MPNGRLYRLAWLLVVLPLVVAAISVLDPVPLPAPGLPATFDARSAASFAGELATTFPTRTPGTPGARGAAQWVQQQLEESGYRVERRVFSEEIPGLGRRRLVNLIAVPARPARAAESPQTIVIVAHRDNAGRSPGLLDNASGTGVLLELARELATTSLSHTLVFVSTDGGAVGGLGARQLAREGVRSPNSPLSTERALATIVLDGLGSDDGHRLVIAGSQRRIAAPALVASAQAALQAEDIGREIAVPSAFSQLVDLAQTTASTDQTPLAGAGVSTITITTLRSDRGSAATADPEALDDERLARTGRAVQSLIASLDGAAEVTRGTAAYLYVGGRGIRGWAIALALLAAVVPAALCALDLVVRSRRRQWPLRAAQRALGVRLLVVGVVLLALVLLTVLGALPRGGGLPLSPTLAPARSWSPIVLGTLGGAWLVARIVAQRWLRPRGPRRPESEAAAGAVALAALCLIAVGVAASNSYALLFLLPSLHAWLWIPAVAGRSRMAATALWVAGWAGPAVLLISLATRAGLGWDAPWYALTLATTGATPLPLALLTAAWVAVSAQLAAVAVGRFRPALRAHGPPPDGAESRAWRAVRDARPLSRAADT